MSFNTWFVSFIVLVSNVINFLFFIISNSTPFSIISHSPSSILSSPPFLHPFLLLYHLSHLPPSFHLALEKVALLIGNQKYEPPISPLVSPENDIRELHKLLEAPPLNYKVISLVNLKFREMMKALETFYEMLAVPGVYALFYYSGHGFNFQGSTYLVPVDATLPLMCENNIEANAIGVSMQSKMSRAIVVLDCCRIR